MGGEGGGGVTVEGTRGIGWGREEEGEKEERGNGER